MLLGPIIETHLPFALRYIPNDPKTILEQGKPSIPIMIGICSNEGAFIRGTSVLFAYYIII